jgi:hypothetical protein
MSQPTHDSSIEADLEKRPFQFSLRSLFVLTFIVALLCSGIAIIRNFYNTHFVAYWEPVESSSAWERALQNLIKDANEKQIEIKQLKVFDLKNRPDWWGPENFWQMDSSPELLSLMSESWALSSINKNNKWAKRFLDKMRNDWRSQNPTDDIEYFALAGRLNGDKSDLYVVMNDKTHKRIFVWYYFNF